MVDENSKESPIFTKDLKGCQQNIGDISESGFRSLKHDMVLLGHYLLDLLDFVS